MSTLDKKTPAASPGGAELLDAMVQEHLDRAAELMPAREEATEAVVPVEEKPVEDAASMLQREIEMLLRDTGAEGDPPVPVMPEPREVEAVVEKAAEVPAEAPAMNEMDAIIAAALEPEAVAPQAVAPAASPAAAPADDMDAIVAAAMADAAPKAVAATTAPVTAMDDIDAIVAAATGGKAEAPAAGGGEQISRAELDVLLAQEAGVENAAVAAGVADAAATPVQGATTDEEAKLQEAENVLADELSKLMEEGAEKTVEAKEEAKPKQGYDAESALAEELSKLMGEEPAAEAKAEPAKQDQQQANDAESVLAAELSKLMEGDGNEAAASKVPEEGAVTAQVEEAKLNEAEGVLADELSKLMGDSEAKVEAPAVTSKSAAIVDESASGAIAAVAEAPAAEPVAEIVEGEMAVHEEVVESEPVVEARPQPGKLRRVLEGIALTVLQLIDLPFVWVDELDKNVIGVAAFLFLVGGVVLFVLSRMPGM